MFWSISTFLRYNKKIQKKASSNGKKVCQLLFSPEENLERGPKQIAWFSQHMKHPNFYTTYPESKKKTLIPNHAKSPEHFIDNIAPKYRTTDLEEKTRFPNIYPDSPIDQ